MVVEADCAFSVIVPTKDRPDYLKRCLRSLASQSMQPIEIIVIDDSESTSQIQSDIHGSAEIKILHSCQQMKVGEKRNLGAMLAKGEFLVFVDDDNELSPTCIVNLLAHVSKSSCAVATRYEPSNTGEPTPAWGWILASPRIQAIFEFIAAIKDLYNGKAVVRVGHPPNLFAVRKSDSLAKLEMRSSCTSHWFIVNGGFISECKPLLKPFNAEVIIST